MSDDLFSRRAILSGAAALALTSAEGRAAVLSFWRPSTPNRQQTTLARMASGYYDVVIYGGTIAGICAATTAVQMGAKVLLLEPTAWLGGMSGPGGLTPIDVKYRVKTGGTVWQMIQQIAVREITATPFMPTTQFPTITAGSSYYQLTMESVAGKNFWRTLYEFAFSSGADIMLNAPLATTAGYQPPAVQMSGATITGLVTSQGVANGKVFIDASYEGDVLAGAAYQGQASYAVGREASTTYGEAYAGFQPSGLNTISGVNFLQGPSPYFPLIPLPQMAPGSADNLIQPCNYRPQLSLATNNTVTPFFQPVGYDRTQFALVAVMAAALGYTNLTDVCGLAPINGGELNFNDGGTQFNFGYLNQGMGYPDGTPSQRADIAAQCKAYIAGLLYFAANDASMPAAVRANAQLYGYCAENYVANQNFPWQMYIREGRRMTGAQIITQASILNGTTTAHPIGWMTYYQDIHSCGCYAAPDGSGYYTDGFAYDSTQGEAQIPMEALMPQAGQCGNLLVPVCASTSHLGWATYRLETTFAIAGDACGVMAAAMVSGGKTAQALNYTTDVLPGLTAINAMIS